MLFDINTILYLHLAEDSYAAVLCRVTHYDYNSMYVEKVTCTKYGENFGPDNVSWNIIVRRERAEVVPYVNWALYVMKGSWDGSIIR